MNCRACGEPVEPRKRFCGECGAPVAEVSGNSASTGGGDLHGGLYQAGRDVVVNPLPNELPSANYEAVPKWRSPWTQALLSWASLIVGLLSLFPLWKLVQPALELIKSGPGGIESGSAQLVWLTIFLVLVLVMILVLSLRRVTKAQLRKPLILGWAVSGLGRRITFEKVRAGDCPECGGKMRYLNKRTKWIDDTDANWRKCLEKTERVPALECKRNPKHWAEVDPAEDAES